MIRGQYATIASGHNSHASTRTWVQHQHLCPRDRQCCAFIRRPSQLAQVHARWSSISTSIGATKSPATLRECRRYNKPRHIKRTLT